ncbi:sensor histidine kinase, partial [Streptomyces sp. NPDC048551]
MDVEAAVRAGWERLKGAEPWSRRAFAGDLTIAAVLAVLGLGIDELSNSSGKKMLLGVVAVVTLTLLRRRLPAATLVLGAAASAFLPAVFLVT